MEKSLRNRQPIRLKGYDYSTPGAYFITICTHHMECLFGDVIDTNMVLNEAGEMVNKCWISLTDRFGNISLDQYIIMPDHFHGIIMINDTANNNANRRGEVISPYFENIVNTGGETPPLRKYTLGQMVAFFKYQSTKIINQIYEIPNYHIWHRNYYDHIIRNQNELNEIRKYIINNPIKLQAYGQPLRLP